MRQIVSLFTLLFSAFLFAQTSCKVDYSVKFIYPENVDNGRFFSIDNDDMNNVMEFSDIYLNANAKEALFTIDVYKSGSRNMAETMAPIMLSYFSPIYSDIEKGINLLQDGGNCIESTIDKDWVFTDEEKIIQGFTCYKATLVKENVGEDTNSYVIAWFCPELPFNFGPNGFGGLPGLILELQVADKYIFGAKKIKLNDKSSEINFEKDCKNVIKEEELRKKSRSIIIYG